MAMFNSYLSLPEGSYCSPKSSAFPEWHRYPVPSVRRVVPQTLGTDGIETYGETKRSAAPSGA